MFCEVERSYIEDGFNLYGLRACVTNFSDCLDLILDRIGPDDSDDSHLTQSACTLYGLIHARYIITAHGLDAMYNKVWKGAIDWFHCQMKSKTQPHHLNIVCLKRIWNMSASTMSGTTSFTARSEGWGRVWFSQSILPQMSMCLPSSTASSRRYWGCRRRSLRDNFRSLVSNDIQQPRPGAVIPRLFIRSTCLWF